MGLAKRKTVSTSASDQRFVVDQDGKKQAVIIPLKEYEQLMEDLHDLAVVAERRDEEAISLDEMKRRLREDGLL
jgi:PHD/YefM family antitoxin component YafN of YafNO toxin-antitoxin module